MRSFYKILAKSITALALLVILSLNSVPVEASPGEIRITTPFVRIEVNPGQNIQLAISINNLGSGYETLSLDVSEPENWQATLKSGGYLVEMVLLKPFENQSLDLTVTQPTDVSLGSYTVEIKALDGAGSVKDSLNVVIDVAEVSPLGLSLSTTNPSIEGPAGEDFQFSADLINGTGEERDVDLSYVAPSNWTITFSPGYETTLVRAVHVRDGERKTLRITVTPAADADAGEYPISIVASSGVYSQTLDLGAVITGSYEAELSTSDGLLNLSAPQGESTPLVFIVQNTGSGLLEKMIFRSNNPSGWEVVFTPSEVAVIEPGTSVQEVVSIKPASDAIPGDYSVELVAYTMGPNVISQKLELRVTVLGSTAWGFVGLLIIVIVVAGLVFIFWRLGRR